MLLSNDFLLINKKYTVPVMYYQMLKYFVLKFIQVIFHLRSMLSSDIRTYLFMVPLICSDKIVKLSMRLCSISVMSRVCLVHSQSLPQLRLGICQSSGMPTLRQKQGVWFTTMPNFRCGRFNSGNCLVHSHMSCHKFGKCMW